MLKFSNRINIIPAKLKAILHSNYIFPAVSAVLLSASEQLQEGNTETASQSPKQKPMQ